ncbi:ImmA/IrrE family metallo-endopeptidase [Hyphomicrobium sp.]|uniref:ImmA/IrrE family metallo-endopeptidase n=1 Tax=Hyphomicrobium sp. TaxID=82 RepID=UPI001DC9247E|nr:ImmA/IrrE family metallo-endopeptidase [Hyphomicrobium sp.]MBY0561002.1 ImmA/IrrE family metallo-endopeptidase [Hyphomicrobium sp.]
MIPQLKSIGCVDKKALTQMAMKAAVKTRARGGLDQISPACIFDLCEKLGVPVRFTDINMEGMYSGGEAPRIFVSSQRPLARRVFTCGHELGHHEFGHGTTIDEMKEEAAALKDENPDEFLVNAFSSFVLMPIIGLRGAFARRRTDMHTATPAQMFAVANNFGVGYATLVTHLAYGVLEIAVGRARELLKATPKSIRKSLLGDDSADPLLIVDPFWLAKPIDAEVGTSILLPAGSAAGGDILQPAGTCATGDIYKAVRPGLGRVGLGAGNEHFVRVSKRGYAGLARYRHMEDDDV